MTDLAFDSNLLVRRLELLAESARDDRGVVSRLALSDTDRAGRDLLVGWLEASGLEVAVDAIGNIFGIWRGRRDGAPLMLGSHIDSVVDAGIYDGCYGVLAALGIVEALQRAAIEPISPVVVAAFTNEEGNRYAPDMMGSLVHVGGLELQAALATIGVDGSVLGDELERIGYAGPMTPGTIRPRAYLELHIEQGPVLEHDGVRIGAVENLQGISWQEFTIRGVANHAGTTPTRLRRDAGLAAARLATYLRDEIAAASATTVATVGKLKLHPDVINVIPSRATLTVDLRDPDRETLAAAEARLAAFVEQLVAREGVAIDCRRLARFDPVAFDPGLVAAVEESAAALGFSCRRMTSGAGHDAQMLARICPAAMIFVPSRDGISHNAGEHTDADDLAAGAAVLLDVTRKLASGDGF